MDIYSLPQTEEAAIEFLQAKNILPTNKICTNCHEMKLSIGKQVRWRCCKSTCRSEINIRSGNWLEGSRIPIVTIVRFIYAWAFEMTSGEFCEREMKICPNTTVDWNNYLRCICVDHLVNKPKKMLGMPKI
ncbi:hypothetical protein ACQ4LE_003891 [Meloidogyne hapla]